MTAAIEMDDDLCVRKLDDRRRLIKQTAKRLLHWDSARVIVLGPFHKNRDRGKIYSTTAFFDRNTGDHLTDHVYYSDHDYDEWSDNPWVFKKHD
jgi:hypothetical protein